VKDYSGGSLVCVPSQNGGLPVLLHPHNATFFFSGSSKRNGVIEVTLCELSQNGCFAERPHRHHQYSPASRSKTYGFFCAMTGSSAMPPCYAHAGN